MPHAKQNIKSISAQDCRVILYALEKEARDPNGSKEVKTLYKQITRKGFLRLRAFAQYNEWNP